jgi:uncharacterized repeat protein (TIGR03803 family)
MTSPRPLICSPCRKKPVFVLVAALTAVFSTVLVQAQTFTKLYDFQGAADGGDPIAGLTLDSEGNLYGTTEAGGSGPCNDFFIHGCGVVYKLSQTGQFTTLYKFQGGTDGAAPHAGVNRDTQGNLYGTTSGGGGADCTFGLANGCGTIFKIDAAGNETVLYRFSGGLDGADPEAGLYLDAGGNLWGTTRLGGILTNGQCSSGCGTLFRLNRNGQLLSRPFQGPPNEGAFPQAGLVADAQGNLFGTTYAGGTNSSGILFKISPTKKLTTLHFFNVALGDAGSPTGLLVSGGKLYGPGASGGADQGGGAIYEVDVSGERVLYSFGPGNDESVLFASGTLARENDGTLYGTTRLGFLGEFFGELYKLDAAGNLEVLHQFLGTPDGDTPAAGVIRDAAGNIYWTTERGGTFNAGTIFKFTP